MGLKLRNANKRIEVKIRQCISLLDDEFKDIDFTINFYEKRSKLLKEKRSNPDIKEEHYKQILSGETEASGVTIRDKKEIKIFMFLYKDIEKRPQEIINLIGNLYHEIRHAWQIENDLYQDEEEINTIDGNIESYLALPSEKDAYIFQDKQMRAHGEKILRIFGFNLGIKYELNPEISKIVYS